MQPMTGTAAPDPEADYRVLRWCQQVRCCPDAMQSPTDRQDLREYSSCTSAQVFPAFEIEMVGHQRPPGRCVSIFSCSRAAVGERT